VRIIAGMARAPAHIIQNVILTITVSVNREIGVTGDPSSGYHENPSIIQPREHRSPDRPRPENPDCISCPAPVIGIPIVNTGFQNNVPNDLL
jgi:hypothetical protein